MDGDCVSIAVIEVLSLRELGLDLGDLGSDWDESGSIIELLYQENPLSLYCLFIVKLRLPTTFYRLPVVFDLQSFYYA